MNDADRALVDQLDEVWSSIAALGASLTEAEWAVPTDCPGWSVQDNLAHIVGIESVLLGRPAPEHTPPDAPHVKNEIGRSNEVWVDWYRARSGPEVLADFREVTAARLAELRAPGADFGAESWTPVGPGTVRDLLPFRVFDSWVHEQDMRRAVGRPGGWAGAPAEATMSRGSAVMAIIVGKNVHPPDGTTVVFDVRGPTGRTIALEMDGGRARPIDAPADPTVRLTLGSETFLRLATGRADPDETLAAGAVELTGDAELGRAIGRAMNFLF